MRSDFVKGLKFEASGVSLVEVIAADNNLWKDEVLKYEWSCFVASEADTNSDYVGMLWLCYGWRGGKCVQQQANAALREGCISVGCLSFTIFQQPPCLSFFGEFVNFQSLSQ